MQASAFGTELNGGKEFDSTRPNATIPESDNGAKEDENNAYGGS